MRIRAEVGHGYVYMLSGFHSESCRYVGVLQYATMGSWLAVKGRGIDVQHHLCDTTVGLDHVCRRSAAGGGLGRVIGKGALQ